MVENRIHEVTGMEDTMNEIDRQDNPTESADLRHDLKTGIINLEKDIQSAQDSSADFPLSPEQANERKRNIIFLNRDLEKMKAEYKDLHTLPTKQG